jgi:phage terminase large subunit-like protein
MAKQRPVPVSIKEILGDLTFGMRRAASRPTIYGYRAQDYQIPFHASTARGKLFIGGNRSGKTVAGGAESVMWLSNKHPNRPVPQPPIYGRGVAVDFEHGVKKIMLAEIARWIPPSLLKNGSWEESYQTSSRTLTLENENKMEFLSYDQDLDKHAGTSRHFIWMDEEPPEDIYNENMLRLMDVGGSWWLTMTPVEGMTWTYDRIYEPGKNGTNPDIYVVEASTDMNMYINQSEIDMYLAGMTEDEKKARRQGKFIQLGGLIYAKNFNAERNVIPSLYDDSNLWQTVKTKWTHFLALDHGFNNPTAVLWLATDADGRVIVYDEYYVSGEIISYHAREIKERNRLLGIDPGYIVGDPSIRNTDPITGTSVLIEYEDHGVTIVLGNNDVKAGINRVARMFEEGKLLITRNCQKTLWEQGRYRWSRYATSKAAANNNVREQPVKKDDHLMDALRYGIASRYSHMDLLVDTFKDSRGFPEASTDIDYELLKMVQEPLSNFDSVLGSEW